MKKVAVIMGSDSDLPVVEKAMKTLDEYGVPYEVHVYSAHRTPEEARTFSVCARENGFGVLICAAGKAAHLAGAIAANTTLPVIGIPIESTFSGMDALLATVQMPPGIPVATVGLNNGTNAGILAAEILSLKYDYLRPMLKTARRAMADGVVKKDAAIKEKAAAL